jgi:hypothetical protein
VDGVYAIWSIALSFLGIIDYHEVKRHLQELGMQDVTDDQAKQVISK